MYGAGGWEGKEESVRLCCFLCLGKHEGRGQEGWNRGGRTDRPKLINPPIHVRSIDGLVCMDS